MKKSSKISTVKFLIYKAAVSVTSVTYLTFFPTRPFFRLL